MMVPLRGRGGAVHRSGRPDDLTGGLVGGSDPRPIAAILIALALLTVALNLYKTIRTPEPAQE